VLLCSCMACLRQSIRRFSLLEKRAVAVVSPLAAMKIEECSTSTAAAMATVWLLAACAQYFKMPLPVGDPIFAIMAGYSKLLAGLSLLAGTVVSACGQPFAGAIVAVASFPFAYKSWQAEGAAEEVRRRFVEGGITAAQQKDAEDALNKGKPPLLMRLSPLLGSGVLDGQCASGVSVQRHHFTSPTGVPCHADVWQLSGSPSTQRPVFFFVHGGSWRAMRPRCHAATCTLHSMALAGWTVVACSYRKAEWPQHIDDAFAVLKWATQFQAPRGKLIIAGNSAGGHIASLLTDRAIRSGVHVTGCVFSYGVYDPQDEEHHYIRFCGKSVLAMYFETLVLRQKVELWSTARPVALELAAYPPTLLLHGSLDGVVPVQQSRQFFARLQAARVRRSPPQDLLVEVPGERHSYEVGGDAAARAAMVGTLAWAENLQAVATP